MSHCAIQNQKRRTKEPPNPNIKRRVCELLLTLCRKAREYRSKRKAPPQNIGGYGRGSAKEFDSCLSSREAVTVHRFVWNVEDTFQELIVRLDPISKIPYVAASATRSKTDETPDNTRFEGSDGTSTQNRRSCGQRTEYTGSSGKGEADQTPYVTFPHALRSDLRLEALLPVRPSFWLPISDCFSTILCDNKWSSLNR